MAGPGPRFAGRSIRKPRNFKKDDAATFSRFQADDLVCSSSWLDRIGSVTFSIISPLFIRDILNNIANSPDLFFSVSDTGYIIVNWLALTQQFAVVLIFYVGSALFSWLSEWLIIPISAKYSYNLRKTFQAKIDTLPLNFFDTQTYGEILSKGTNDVDTIARSMQQIITQVIYSIFCFSAVPSPCSSARGGWPWWPSPVCL
jgi:ATP-binding cassette subfamily B protein